MMRALRLLGAGTVAAGFMVFSAKPVHAANGESCEGLTDVDNAVPHVYIENGDTQEPLVKRIGALLVKSTAGKIRIFYRNRPTCNIRNDMFAAGGTNMTTVVDGTTARPVRYIPDNFDPTTAAPQCIVPPDGTGTAQPIVLGIGATYLSSCPVLAQPTDIAVFEGPTQAYGFITHKDSNQVAITGEEGYLSWGFTEGGGEASPWIIQALRFRRSTTASTTLTMSSAIRLKATDMKGTQLVPDTSDEIINNVKASANPNATLGILGLELFDQHRTEIKLLAFKTFGQKYAYFPDKTNATFDKQNVRDGHYLPWSPTPYIAKLDGAGSDPTHIANANAKRIYELVAGARPGDDVDGILQVVKSGLVPKCAMKVQRAGDGADLAMYSDPAPCGCYFEKNVPNGATACTVCTADASCTGATPKCRFGYCEAK